MLSVSGNWGLEGGGGRKGRGKGWEGTREAWEGQQEQGGFLNGGCWDKA